MQVQLSANKKNQTQAIITITVIMKEVGQQINKSEDRRTRGGIWRSRDLAWTWTWLEKERGQQYWDVTSLLLQQATSSWIFCSIEMTIFLLFFCLRRRCKNIFIHGEFLFRSYTIIATKPY